MSGEPVRRLRPSAHQIGIYNSAGTIYLYDEANREAITRANPSLLSGYHAVPARDEDAPLLALGERGMLVVFELYQDDELQAELSLGPPLRADEDGLPWSEPRRALLSLPSGRLCIESMDSLRIGPEEGSDEGATVALPPGEYVLSLQCLGRDHEQDPEALVPEYYLSLEPLTGERPDNHPFLTYPR